MTNTAQRDAQTLFASLVTTLGGVATTASLFQVHERTVKNWLAQGGPRRGPAKILSDELMRRHGLMGAA